MELLGIDVPDTRPLFAAAVAVHVVAGLVAVLAGAVAARATKAPGRHPRAGRVYLGSLVVVASTAAVLAAMRWPRDVHLAVLGTVSLAAGAAGWRARRRRRPGWTGRHLFGMAVSYVLLITAFYVDNGPRLPGWRLLPMWAMWVFPTLLAAPVVARALRRRGLKPWRRRGRCRRTAAPRSPRPAADSH